ncbi:MAG: DUF1684 domain-containing protein [Saonia sp.]
MRYFLLFLAVLTIGMGCSNKKKYHDVVKAESGNSTSGAINDILQFQKELDKAFKDPETSPLPDRYRKDFKGLNFFESDTNYRIMAKLVRTPDAIPFMMPTTTDRKSAEVVYGIAHFQLNGKPYQVEVYRSPELQQKEKYKDYLFLPFLDETNGTETYSGGRYIDLSSPEGDSIQIDFNKAYNPYCAYNKKYSCPIVPKVNLLDTKVLAGVKAFKKE